MLINHLEMVLEELSKFSTVIKYLMMHSLILSYSLIQMFTRQIISMLWKMIKQGKIKHFILVYQLKNYILQMLKPHGGFMILLIGALMFLNIKNQTN